MVLTRGAGRWARSATFGIVAVALALLAHVLADGAIPSPAVVVLAGFLTTAVTTAMTGRRCGRLEVVCLLAVSQLGLHALFQVLGPAATCTVSSQGQGLAAMTGHGSAGPTCIRRDQDASAAMGSMHLSGGMLLAHVVGTAVLALVLAHGEDLLWSLAACLTHRLPQPTPARPGVRLPQPVLRGRTRPAQMPHRLPPRRGPPAAALS